MTEPADAESADRLVERANALLALRRPVEAILWLQRALAREPRHYQALCDLALAHYRLGQHADASCAAEQAALANPPASWPHSLRALILQARKRRKEALAAAEEAVRLGPQDVWALYVLAEVQARADLATLGQLTAERLREVAPEEPLAYEALALVALRRGRWQEAEGYCRQALALDPESISAQLNLGLALRRQYRTREAVEVVEGAARLRPADASVQDHLIASFESFQSHLPPLPRVLLALGYSLGALAVGLNVALGASIIVAIFLLDRRYRNRRLLALPPAAVAFARSARGRLLRRRPARRVVLTVLAIWLGLAAIGGILSLFDR